MNKVIITQHSDPYRNLALEEYLFDSYQEGVTLYLWQNDKTIVIGRNQNAYRECKVREFESSGGRLARRTTGGGAVYHDLGNLCFTFIAKEGLYDEKKQLGVILDAIKKFGLNGEMSGRNDLVMGGRKFSGNAFRHSKGKSIHHGTILIDTDLYALSKYLTASEAKIKAKGIESVRSRVVNLSELANIDINRLKDAIAMSFKDFYGGYTEVSDDIKEKELEEKIQLFSSEEWRLGENPSFDITLENRFNFGEFSFCFNVKKGAITGCKVYSDTLFPALPSELEDAFTGKPFSAESLALALTPFSLEIKKELVEFFSKRV